MDSDGRDLSKEESVAKAKKIHNLSTSGKAFAVEDLFDNLEIILAPEITLEDLQIPDIQAEIQDGLTHLEQNPTDLRIILYLSVLYFWKREFASASKVLRRLDPLLDTLPPKDLKKIYYFHAKISAGLENYENSTENYTKALALDPDYLYALHNIGCNYLSLKNFQNALLQFEKIIEKFPRNLKTLINLGYSYLWAERHQLAIQLSLF